ncbi:hypothetical protein C289_1500 [Anoxybacillus ayderensis]|uniref:Uncharacterized protein n=1 Tax=Anoxybacillus flavithermus TaxID=33934 RepID=A0A2G5RMM9_9BACL|nr:MULTISPECIES: hypothetical protein [Anoxybacillus]EPZ38348.1 hypothetical protein C289_1500 [Anoxybacillus ayderensis]KFZ41673.1 hypothetical protein JS80_15365 [Anoxybacillus sp. KU2-6(11)]PIC03987.1 hypothetical protein CS060_12195 [Anoxybacillus flavithermus]QAV26931.1 hypothetical protein BTDUT50_10010 [Neobacillus thermocopriae]
MKKWAVMLFYTIGVAAVTYVSFRLALFGIFEATQFPNRLFLFGLTLLLFGTLAIGAGARKYIFSVSNNKQERTKLQASFLLCTVAAIWVTIWFLV